MSRILDAASARPTLDPAQDGGTDVADLSGRKLRRGTMKTAALILHDDEPTLALVRGLVESAGFEPLGVSSVYKLVLDDAPVAPRFVILGVTAIDERDLEIVAVLRSRWPRAFFLVLFPASLRERAARAVALGADSYLPEPFYAGELMSIAKRVAASVAADTTGPIVVAETEPPPRARAGGVEQLAAGVAHSIRNPLQILELQLGTVESDGPVDVPGMREQVRRIAGVVESLARFYGRRDVAARPVDVGQIVADVFGERKGAAPVASAKGGAVKTAAATATVLRPAAERAVVLASPELLRAGFEILRNRAARVTPPTGSVEARVQIRAEASKRIVEIAVSDGGPALSDERRNRLFDPFADAEGVQDGTGLELAAFAGIVRDHGGSIAALPAGETGTTILVRLPATDAASLPADAGAP